MRRYDIHLKDIHCDSDSLAPIDGTRGLEWDEVSEFLRGGGDWEFVVTRSGLAPVANAIIMRGWTYGEMAEDRQFEMFIGQLCATTTISTSELRALWNRCGIQVRSGKSEVREVSGAPSAKLVTLTE